MKIGIQTWGSEGDIRPYLSLAIGLKQAGFDVKLVITSCENKSYESFAQKFGFEISSCAQQTIIEQMKGVDAKKDLFDKINRRHNPVSQLKVIFDYLFYPAVDEIHAAAIKLCEESDLIIAHPMLYPLQTECEKRGIRYIVIQPNHMGVKSKFIAPAIFPNICKWTNLLGWKVVELTINLLMGRKINSFRVAQQLQPAKSIRRDVWNSKLMNIIAVSKVFCARYPDSDPIDKVCGFLPLPEEGGVDDLDKEVAEFIDAGEPPLFFTFGTMFNIDNLDETVFQAVNIFIETVKQLNCRAIIQAPWQQIKIDPGTELILPVESLPHRLVFPHCSVVIHHGGAGTTQMATLCGCPSIVVEHLVDQRFWGNELKRIGVCPAVIDRRKLNSKKLLKAIKQIQENPKYKEDAVKASQIMQSEGGVDNVVKAIEELIKL